MIKTEGLVVLEYYRRMTARLFHTNGTIVYPYKHIPHTVRDELLALFRQVGLPYLKDSYLLPVRALPDFMPEFYRLRAEHLRLWQSLSDKYKQPNFMDDQWCFCFVRQFTESEPHPAWPDDQSWELEGLLFKRLAQHLESFLLDVKVYWSSVEDRDENLHRLSMRAISAAGLIAAFGPEIEPLERPIWVLLEKLRSKKKENVPAYCDALLQLLKEIR